MTQFRENLSFLLNVYFCTALLSLADVVLLLSLDLSFTITSNASDSTTYGTSNTIANTRTQVVQLSLSLLSLTSKILFTSITF